MVKLQTLRIQPLGILNFIDKVKRIFELQLFFIAIFDLILSYIWLNSSLHDNNSKEFSKIFLYSSICNSFTYLYCDVTSKRGIYITNTEDKTMKSTGKSKIFYQCMRGVIHESFVKAYAIILVFSLKESIFNVLNLSSLLSTSLIILSSFFIWNYCPIDFYNQFSDHKMKEIPLIILFITYLVLTNLFIHLEQSYLILSYHVFNAYIRMIIENFYVVNKNDKSSFKKSELNIKTVESDLKCLASMLNTPPSMMKTWFNFVQYNLDYHQHHRNIKDFNQCTYDNMDMNMDPALIEYMKGHERYQSIRSLNNVSYTAHVFMYIFV